MGADAPAINWTDQQRKAIETVDRSLLVSAAAGSGKTAVLAERCAHLVCDTQAPCDVDDLLVVTFTEAAAAEMKRRVGESLHKRASQQSSEQLRNGFISPRSGRPEGAPLYPNEAECPSGATAPRVCAVSKPLLTRQLALIDHAQVSTLHGFCARLLRQHFHLAQIDPAFRILDSEEASLLRREIARDLLRDSYGGPTSAPFERFVDSYGEGDDQRLVRLLVSTHEMLSSLCDPNQWLRAARDRIRDAATKPLAGTELGQELHKWIGRGLETLSRQCDATLKQLRRLRFGPYEKFIAENFAPAIRDWTEIFESDGVDALAESVVNVKFPDIPRTAATLANKDLAKAAVDELRDSISKSPWRDALRFSTAQWQQGMAATLPHAQTFFNLVGQFARRYRAAKDSARALDFSDLERLSLKVLSDNGKPSPTARAYQKRFQHVLVDEYQDINELQDTILSLLSHESAAEPGQSHVAERISPSPGISGGGQGWGPSDKRFSSPQDPHPASPGVPGEVKGGNRAEHAIALTAKPRLKPNLFCVGDVKQSIYRFRLAEPERFLNRERQFRGESGGGEVIDLQANFRSRGPLVEAINQVFERLMTAEAADINYDQSHRLVAKRSFPPPPDNGFVGSPIELHILPNQMTDDGPADDSDSGTDPDRTEREAMFVSRRIRELMGLADGSRGMVVADGMTAVRPIRFSDIVILLRSMRYKSEQFVRILAAEGIPVHADSVTGYFASMEVRDMFALLHVLDNRQQDIPLATVLRSPFGRLPNPDDAMARIRLAYPPTAEGDVPFHQAVVRYAREHKDELAAHLSDVLADFDQWRQASRRRPLDELLWDIYQESGYLAFCQGLSNGDQRVANLLLMQERARQFGTFQRQGLSRFLEFLESLHDDADIGLPSTASSAGDVVRIMSVHRSKGLEFPVVVLPDLGKKINLQDCQGAILTDRKLGLGLSVVDEERRVRYPSLASSLVKNRLRQQAMAEELRVFYVAMTRAEEHLILVGTATDKTAAGWGPRWSNHVGPLPAEEILGASSMLDWIGPVSAAAANCFAVFPHTAEQVAGPKRGGNHRTEVNPRLAALQPLESAGPPTDAAQRVIARLETEYPFAKFTKIPAAQSVTGHSQPAEIEIPSRSDFPKLQKVLERPRFLVAEKPISPTERGTATHRVLQHLDFCRPCDSDDIAAQVAKLVERRSLSAAEAAAVDRAAIVWFAGSDVGGLLREHAGRLRREIPVYFTLDDQEADPGDRRMIRGRLDLLLPLEDGHVIVDYKTDAVDRASATARAGEYRNQMELYRQAIGRITRQPVREIHLVFLTPRWVVTI
jgi:ATP-dependent helicase/nuclease subunit A